MKAITKKLENFFLLNLNRSIPEFDGLRAWAVIMVLAVHIQSWLLNIASETHENSFTIQAVQKIFHFMPFIGSAGGEAGVDLFFMISGFLIFLTIHRKKTSFLEFIKKRYKRLLPVHIILILYSIVFLPLIGIFLNLFFLVDFFPSYSNVNPVTWTLGYEMLFYLIAGIWFITLAKVIKLQGWPFFFIVFIAVLLSQWIMGSLAEDIGLKYPDMNRFISFFFGVGLAKVYYLNNILWEKMSCFLSQLFVPGLIIVSIFRYFFEYITNKYFLGSQIFITTGYIFLDIGFLLIMASLLCKNDTFIKRFFRSTFLRIIGVISYSMYLFHFNFALPMTKSILDPITDVRLKLVMYIPLSFIVTIIFSIFLFHFLEKPYFKKK